MNTIEKLGDEETFRQIVERSIASFEDNELTEVAEYSFYGCDKLADVSIPNATTIGEYAFKGCANLNSLNLPKVTNIGSEAFYGCSLLPEISFPLLTTVPNSAFKRCTALSAFNLPKVTKIEGSAFEESGLPSVEFPLVTTVEYNAFSLCKNLSAAKLPKAKSIGSSAFYSCFSMTSIIVGTELDDETAICTLGSTSSLPSSISAIYVPYNLQDKYKTATNWSSFVDKIQGYEVPVSCLSLTITAEDVPGYKTSTKVHYEAVCTYSIEGMLQTGTKVFIGDAVSDTFSANPSEESSRQVEVSYTFLGQIATTTITQDKYMGNPVGGKIYYIDDTADGTYEFYDAEGNLMSDVSVGSTPSYYKVVTPGSKDKYYVYHDELYSSFQWGKYNTTTGASGTTIGTGKSNTATLLATDAVSSTNTIWYKLQQIRNASTGGCDDWFVPSKDEVEALRLAIGCTTSTSGAVVVDASAITGGTIAGTADGRTHYKSYNGTYYCYPSATKFLDTNLWSSSECSAQNSWLWYCYNQYWRNNAKDVSYSVFFARAF